MQLMAGDPVSISTMAYTGVCNILMQVTLATSLALFFISKTANVPVFTLTSCGRHDCTRYIALKRLPLVVAMVLVAYTNFDPLGLQANETTLLQ